MTQADWRITFPIEKAEEREDGLYITGLASGPEVDAQGERMAPSLITKFANQINAGGSLPFSDRLPYRDAHTKDGVLIDLGAASKAWVNDQGRLGVEIKLDDENPAAKFLFKQIQRGKQFGMSVHGQVFDYVDEYAHEIGKTVRTIKDVLLDEISNTTRPAWTPSFGSVVSKAIDDEQAEISKGVWDTAYINNLPDSSFAYIESGGKKDADGKTTPRDLRHLPYKDENGKPDAAHVRNALARLSQTQISAQAKAEALSKLTAAAKNLGIDTAQKNDEADAASEGDSVVTDELKTGEDQPVVEATKTEEVVVTPEAEKTEEVVEAPETEKSDESKTPVSEVEKAGAAISAATKAHILAMHSSAVAHLANMQAEMHNMGIDSALGMNEETDETSPDNETAEAQKTDSKDEPADTLSKTGEETPVAEPTPTEREKELEKSLREMTEKVQNLENNRTQLPPVIEHVEQEVDELEKSMRELTPSARLRVGFATMTKGQ